MDNPYQAPESQRSPSLLRELLTAIAGLLRSELRLARAELRHSAVDAGRQLGKSAVFFMIAAVGALCLVAFFIIGLGVLLDDRYWLSALIVGLVFLVPGLALGIRSLRAASEAKSLPHLRGSLREDTELLRRRIAS